jgi:type II secretory pathway component PulM
MLAAIQGGQGFEAAAALQGWTPRRIGPFLRSARGAGAPSAPVLAAIFGLKPGEATMVEANNAFIVLAVASVTVPAPTEDRLAALRANLAAGMADDLEAQFAQFIQRRADASINPRAIQLMIGTDP